MPLGTARRFMLKHYLVPLSTVIVSLYIDTLYRSPMSSSIIIPRPHLQLLLLLVVGVMVLSCATQGRQTPPPEDAHTLPLTADTIVADLSRDSLTTEITQSTEDSLVTGSDSLLRQGGDTLLTVDTLTQEALSSTINPDTTELFRLDAPVTFSAQDSLVMTGENIMYFFGPSNVKYQSMSIESNYLKIVADSSEVYAQYVLDSLGQPFAKPKFADGDQKFESTTMKYNFKTGQGFITDVTTQQGEGYLTANQTKRLKDNTMFLKDGRYTTCDLHDHPHFYINLTRAKAKPEDKIVTGPVYLVMADVPLYLIGLPFAFFPFNEKQTSGILMPSYGIDQTRGLYLNHGGFYLNINDYWDLTLTGDVYTSGSWSINANSNYRRRYKYNGSVQAGYVCTIQGDKDIPSTYSRAQDISLRWRHSQDPKADPLRNFSASVNFATSSYNHNSTQAVYNHQRREENTKGSSISYRRSFASIPLSLTAAFNIDQRSRDSTISVTLPNLSLSLSTIYPLKRKNRVGRERWYEKISLSYSGSLRNSITTKENLLLKSNLVKDWRNGMQHSIPISASFDLFNYIKLSPSINYTAYWYTSHTEKRWDDKTQKIVAADTTYGFYHLNNFSASLSMSTTLYGFYKPWQKLFGDRVQMIRHRLSPSISLSYAPDFSDPRWGYYREIQYTDSQGQSFRHIYTPYESGIFGYPGRGKTGALNFSFDNNVEMKWRLPNDSVQAEEKFRKISLIDQFGMRFSYNMAADSFRWSNLNTNIAVRLSKSFVLRLSASFDPYVWDYYMDDKGRVRPYRVDKLRILNGRGIGAFMGTGTSLNYTFTPQTFKKLETWLDRIFSKDKGKDKPDPGGQSSAKSPADERTPGGDRSRDRDNISGSNANSGRKRSGYGASEQWDSDGYLTFDVPWSFSFNYSVNVAQDRQHFNTHRKEFDYMFTQNLSFRGQLQPTPNWQFSFDANYNFDLKRLTGMTINITRDLHCWSLTASVIPIGAYKSYNLVIGVNASLLRDLKWEQHSLPTYGSGDWY